MADKILSFGAMLLDTSTAERREDHREVRIFYHLEDETIRVVEMPTHNAGAIQGTLVGRQRVPTVMHPTSSHLNMCNFKVGDIITILGRRYYIISCDPATRTYLTRLGLKQPPDLCDPSLTAFQDYLPASTPAAGIGKLQFSSEWPKQYTLATFVNKAGQVLRFFGEWADHDKRNGGVTTPVTEKVEFRYYLEDDTAEVRVHQLTPHQDALTPAKPQLPFKYLKRGPVAKELSELNGASSLGAVGRPTLNLVGLRGVGAHLKDRRPQALPSPSFLKPSELILGNTVSVGGRLLRLCECDSFTTNYYKNVLDVDQVPAGYLYLQKRIGMGQTPRTTPLDPRWLEEPPKDPLHPLPTTVTTKVGGFHARDIRDGYENKILRFGARLVTEKEKDREREFVINFYVFDSTVSVFEIPKLNSGMRAGMFLSRGLVVKGEGGEHVRGQDLYAGNVVTLNSHTFYITHADDFTLMFMEKHADEFPQANYNVALDKARQALGHHKLTNLLQKLSPSDPHKTGFVSTSLVHSSLVAAIGPSVSHQQVASLLQRHRQKRAAPLSREQLTHLASLHLKRRNFDGIPDLLTGLKGRDIEMKGVLPHTDVRAAVIATKLPLPAALTDALVVSVTREDGMVDYAHFCRELDYRVRPHIHDHIPCQLDEASLDKFLKRAQDRTDYINLIADLEGSANTHHYAGTGLV